MEIIRGSFEAELNGQKTKVWGTPVIGGGGDDDVDDDGGWSSSSS